MSNVRATAFEFRGPYETRRLLPVARGVGPAGMLATGVVGEGAGTSWMSMAMPGMIERVQPAWMLSGE